MTVHTKPPADPFLRAANEPELVELPPAKFICVEGAGAPEHGDFQAAVGALYGVVYTMKFTAKKAGGRDFQVAPLEALWWANVPRHEFDLRRTPRTAWRWKAMLRVPASVTKAQVEAAKQAVTAKRGDHDVSKVVLEKFAEGRAVQLLHIGPYATEPASVARMRSMMDASKLVPRGYHHEIYLGDPRRTKPEKLKTILRQPVAAA